jgi:hypothetical protein
MSLEATGVKLEEAQSEQKKNVSIFASTATKYRSLEISTVGHR